MTVKLLLF